MLFEIPLVLSEYFSRYHGYLIFLGIIACYLMWRHYHNGLHKIPGPFIASISSIWKLNAVWWEDMPQRNNSLHEKLGPLVRIGPNHVSASSAEALQTIHRAKTGFTKVLCFLMSARCIAELTDRQSLVYGILQPQFNNEELHNVFSTQDPDFHAKLKRKIGSLYTMTAVTEFEFHIDSCTQLLASKMGEFAQQQLAVVDMSAWLQYYAFDCLGEINFSCKLGFLDTGLNVKGICKLDHKQMMYFALVRLQYEVNDVILI